MTNDETKSLQGPTNHHSPITNHYVRSRGEGGIRTLDTLLGYGALAKRCFQPLSHLTNRTSAFVPQSRDYGATRREYDGELSLANTDIRRVLAIFIGVGKLERLIWLRTD